MMIFPHELIGKEVRIIRSTNQSHIGVQGKIVDETKSTLRIEVNGVIKTFLKNVVDLQVIKTGKELKGISLLRSPEERLKGC